MGHLLSLFDRDWLGVPATGRMAFLARQGVDVLQRTGQIHRTRSTTATDNNLETL